MNGIWLISYLALWLIVALLFLGVVVLARQIGLLHRRLVPASARMMNYGPKIGERAPIVTTVDAQGREVSLGVARGKQTLLVFMSATCPSCAELAPALKSVWKSERDSVEVVVVSLGGDEKTNRNFVTRHKLDDIPYVLSKALGNEYNVLAPPYGVLIDETGVVRSKGVVNHLDHLESLLEAARIGHPSLESWALSQQVGVKKEIGQHFGP
jgi:methylamine dehydrogenase accessory protein MauD